MFLTAPHQSWFASKPLVANRNPSVAVFTLNARHQTSPHQHCVAVRPKLTRDTCVPKRARQCIISSSSKGEGDAAADLPSEQHPDVQVQAPSEQEEDPAVVEASADATSTSEVADGAAAGVNGEALLKILEAFQDHQTQRQATIPTTCLNCTARVRMGSSCRFCGHHTDDDDALRAAIAAVDANAESSADSEVLLAWDAASAMHGMPPPPPAEGQPPELREFIHPERPERSNAIIHRMQQSGIAGMCRSLPFRDATQEELEAVHDPGYLSSLENASEVAREKGRTLLVGDHAFIGENSWTVMRRSAGTSAEMAKQLVSGGAKSGLVVTRPPGHLASREAAQGFCFLNNAAVAAWSGRMAGAERVAVVDWGVHHGRGTQDIFAEDSSVLTISLHRHERGECFPGTGAAEDVGKGDGLGYNINIPFDTQGVSDGDYLAAFRHCVVPVLRQYQPSLIVIAAGFDSAEDDHLGNMALTPQGYATMTRALLETAPTMLVLEGGYNLEITAECFEACAITLLDTSMAPHLSEVPSAGPQPTYTGLLAISKTLAAVSQYWPSVPAPDFAALMEMYGCFGAVAMLEKILAERNSGKAEILEAPGDAGASRESGESGSAGVAGESSSSPAADVSTASAADADANAPVAT